MIIAKELEKASLLLRQNANPAPVFEAGVILSNILKKDRAYLYCHPEDTLSEGDILKFEAAINERLKGVPLQYITGRQEFMSLDFEVNSSVLIPRQDTEVLVEHIINYCSENKIMNPQVLDIGTGSGCIAVSIAYYIPDSRILAVDVSVKALQTARNNAVKNKVQGRIEFFESSLYKNVPNNKKFDIIVSNPPYIPTSDIADLDIEVKREPVLALDGGCDGLDFYRAIIEKSPEYLNKDGMLALEVGIYQHKAVADLLKRDFKDIKVLKDLSGIERVLSGIRK